MGDQNIPVSDEPLPSNLAQFRRMTQGRMVNPTTETESDARSHLVEAYMSGQPLFTKKNIRYAWEQTQRRPGHGGKVYSKDIKGNTVEYTVDFTGSGIPDNCNCGDCEDNHNTVVKWDHLSLLYATKVYLTGNFLKSSDGPLCPVSIVHDGYAVSAETNELLPPPLTYDLEGVAGLLSAGTLDWKNSMACRKLRSILSAAARTHRINKTIGFALGALSPSDRCLGHSVHSATRHALLLTLNEWLQRRDGGEKKPCYVQDSSYNSLDKQVLERAGVQVIDDPRGWLEVDEQSIVVSVTPAVVSNTPIVPVKEIIADIARPAVIIWERVGVENLLNESDQSDPCSLRVVDMMEDYDMHFFGAGRELSTCGNLVLYIRKSKTAVPPNLR
ncbi:unnamed protein product [Penicillium bialowiezense]